jgi:anti-sigma-K factor RskA
MSNMDEKPQLAHEQYAEDLALYALGALQAGSCAQIEQHLKECSACRRELEAMRGDSAVLALAVAGPTPPVRSRERLLSAVASPQKEGQSHLQASFAVRRPWWSFAPVFASLALAVIALFLVRENTSLTQANEQLLRQIAIADKEGRKAREVLALMTAKDTMHVSLVSTGAPPPHVHTIYQPRTGRLCMMASNLKPLPAGMTYELWLIPKSGAPMPAGMFKPDSEGMAMMMPENPEVPAGTEAKAFAVTMEPEGGSQAPSGEPLLQGSGL